MRRYLARVATLAASLILGSCATAGDSLLLPSRDRAYRALWAFDGICLAHRLDRAGALKAAADDGWIALPQGGMATTAVVEGLTGGARMKVADARWKPSGQGDMVLLLGVGGEAGDQCAIAFHSGFRMASAVMGGSEMLPIRRSAAVAPKHDLWIFIEEHEGRRALNDLGANAERDLMANAKAQRRFATIAVIGAEREDAALYLYSIPRP